MTKRLVPRRSGGEPPDGWERDPEDSRPLRSWAGSLSPGESQSHDFYHQRPFVFDGVGGNVEGRIVASFVVNDSTFKFSVIDVELSMLLATNESGLPAFRKVTHPGDRIRLALVNAGDSIAHFSVTLQGMEQM